MKEIYGAVRKNHQMLKNLPEKFNYILYQTNLLIDSKTKSEKSVYKRGIEVFFKGQSEKTSWGKM